jgi:hypothetical protein
VLRKSGFGAAGPIKNQNSSTCFAMRFAIRNFDIISIISLHVIKYLSAPDKTPPTFIFNCSCVIIV